MLNLNHLKLIIVAYFLLALPLSAQGDVDNDRLIEITTLAQLNVIRYDINGTGSPAGDAAVAYRTAFNLSPGVNNTCTDGCDGYELINDLDFKNGSATASAFSIWAEGSTASGFISTGWEPIGDGGPTDSPRDDNPFTTTFEGNGHTISNLYISTTGIEYAGLFGGLGSGAEIRNLGLEGGSVTSTAARAQVGGLVGRNSAGILIANYSTGDVTGGNSTYVGGLVGYNDSGPISACYATGDVTGGNSASVGGLVGLNYSGPISACYATGDISGGNSASVGGLVGLNYSGPISACYSTGDVTGGKNAYVGGLLGNNNSAEIVACYSTGSARGGTSASVGGLVGLNYSGPISACYATGDISGGGSADAKVGGLVGQNYGSGAMISACYSTGSARGGTDAFVGGLVGLSQLGSISNSYFDKETSRLENGIGSGRGAPGTALAKTTSELQLPEDYTAIYSAWNVDIGGTSAADDPWDFVGHNRYPRPRVDFDGNGTLTVAEFGAQRFYFTKTDPGIEVFSLSVSDEAVASTIIGYAKALSGTTTWALTDANFAINSGTGVITVQLEGATVATKMLSIEAMVGSVTTELNLNVEVTDVIDTSPSPTITRFEDAAGATLSPATAVRGATVKIIGTNFSTTPANNTITVGGIEVIPTSPTATVLTFTVPGAAAIGAGQIRASVLGAANYVEAAFMITTTALPTIIRFEDAAGATLSPTATAVIGDIVKIIGTNFSTTPANNTITVGSATATPTNATATELTFTVPLTATLGLGKIRVTVSGAASHVEEAFTITAPPLAFAEASTSDTDVGFTGAMGAEKAKYVVTKTLDEVDAIGDVVLTLNVAPSGTTTYAYVDMDGADADAPTGLVSPIPASGAISTTAALAVTSSPTDFYVKATQGTNFVIAKVELSVKLIVFVAPDPPDTDVVFTGASGTEKAKYVVTKTLDEVDASGDVVLTLNVAPSGTTTYAYVNEGGTAILPAPTGLSPIRANGEITTDSTLAVTSMAAVFYVQATQAANFVIAKVELTVNAAPALAFAAPAPTDADVAFTAVSGATKAKYVVTKTLDEVDESGDVVLTLNVDPSGTTAYAYVDMDGALTLTPPSRLVRPIPASGAISTDAALAVTSTARVFYVKATRDGASVIAKVELTVTAAATTDFLGLTNPVHDLVSLYPNPASDRVYVSGLKSGDVYIYEIYSFLGQKVGTGQLSEGPSIDLKSLSAGAYVLILRSESGEEVFRSRCLISK